MSYCKTLRAECDRAPHLLELELARHHIGPAQVRVYLVAGTGPNGAFAVLTAEHVDPEGIFVEILPVPDLLDRVGEGAFADTLAGTTFDSGISAGVLNWNEVARHCPAVLTP